MNRFSELETYHCHGYCQWSFFPSYKVLGITDGISDLGGIQVWPSKSLSTLSGSLTDQPTPGNNLLRSFGGVHFPSSTSVMSPTVSINITFLNMIIIYHQWGLLGTLFLGWVIVYLIIWKVQFSTDDYPFCLKLDRLYWDLLALFQTWFKDQFVVCTSRYGAILTLTKCVLRVSTLLGRLSGSLPSSPTLSWSHCYLGLYFVHHFDVTLHKIQW